MKMLRVVPSMNPEYGGVSQAIRNVIPALQNFGIASEILCFDAPHEEFLGQDDLVIHPIGPAKGPYGYCPGFNDWMASHLSRFDVVIIDGLWQYHSFATIRSLLSFRQRNSTDQRVFVMPHGMLDPYFQRAKSRRLKAIRNYAFWKLIEHRVINGADGILFTCETELKLARIPFSPYRPIMERNVGFGIQSPPPPTSDQGTAFFDICPAVKGKPYWLFLGRIHPKKGVDLLIKAYLKLREEYQELPDLVIAGPGLETVYGASLTGLKDLSGVHFPGMLRGEAKWGAFYNCEIFILPSHQENFGIAVVEALACGKPVLISDQVNIFREIVDGGAGFADKDSEEGTFRLLKGWFNLKSEHKESMQENASKVYKRKFTIESAAKRFVKVLYDNSQPRLKINEMNYGRFP